MHNTIIKTISFIALAAMICSLFSFIPVIAEETEEAPDIEEVSMLIDKAMIIHEFMYNGYFCEPFMELDEAYFKIIKDDYTKAAEDYYGTTSYSRLSEDFRTKDQFESYFKNFFTDDIAGQILHNAPYILVIGDQVLRMDDARIEIYFERLDEPVIEYVGQSDGVFTYNYTLHAGENYVYDETAVKTVGIKKTDKGLRICGGSFVDDVMGLKPTKQALIDILDEAGINMAVLFNESEIDKEHCCSPSESVIVNGKKYLLITGHEWDRNEWKYDNFVNGCSLYMTRSSVLSILEKGYDGSGARVLCEKDGDLYYNSELPEAYSWGERITRSKHELLKSTDSYAVLRYYPFYYGSTLNNENPDKTLYYDYRFEKQPDGSYVVTNFVTRLSVADKRAPELARLLYGTNPATGDSTMTILSAIALISLAAAFVFVKKRRSIASR